jgi:hypothetical protein
MNEWINRYLFRTSENMNITWRYCKRWMKQKRTPSIVYVNSTQHVYQKIRWRNVFIFSFTDKLGAVFFFAVTALDEVCGSTQRQLPRALWGCISLMKPDWLCELSGSNPSALVHSVMDDETNRTQRGWEVADTSSPPHIKARVYFSSSLFLVLDYTKLEAGIAQSV